MLHLPAAEQIQIGIPVAVVLVLLYLCLKFFLEYWLPARRLCKRLRNAVDLVRQTKSHGEPTRREALTKVFKGTSFEHSWLEYQDTLHDQIAMVDGESQVVRTRATARSAYFFNTQTIIETPIRAEYFKHLPGILTGIGIIGTFFGLLLGLSSFDPSDPAKVQESLRLLLSGVRDAFIASACAIASAMLITNAEKKNFRACVAELEKLTDAIDQLFDAGVTEEYLADLVRHTQESSVQTRHLKDSLVSDLRTMLQNLVDTQVAESLKLAESLSTSYKDAGQDMAASISKSIENSFKDPLEQIARSVQTAAGDQSVKVESLLQDVLVAFMKKIDTSFGTQFTGMQEMLTQSVTSMQEMQSGFKGLVDGMRTAGESSSKAVQEQLSKTLTDMQAGQRDQQEGMRSMLSQIETAVQQIGMRGEEAGKRMGDQLQKLFADSEARQRTMAEEMHGFVAGLRETVGKGHQDTVSEIASTVAALGGQLSAVLSTVESNRVAMDQASSTAQQELHAGTTGLLAQLGKQVEELATNLKDSHEATRRTISQLGEQTDRSLSGMQLGAEKMRTAADAFGAAGERMGEAGTVVTGAVAGLETSVNGLGKATMEVASVVAEYRANRDAVAETMRILKDIVAGAQAEAGMRGQVLEDMKSMNGQLQILNQEANEYLGGVTELLSNSFGTFGEGVEKSLERSLGTLDQELDKALKALGGGIQDLSENLDTFGDVIEKSIRRHA